ncbi:MAG: RimK/LysX family protein [Fimbriimonadaceae bacterium]|nr:RimK/LysX family protein [Fimbriimonadaceae bacterium]QYK56970.1 MAG: RimK/LysX family protein [Fimbriimonadaceae bacterium]
MAERLVIGWREFVDLPEWGIEGLHAKIDTGARSSAVHVEQIEEVGEGRIRFQVVLDLRHRHKRVTVEAPISRRSHVTSSNGVKHERYFVETLFRLGPVEKRVEISLVSRDNMKVRMLVGRTALGDEFLVDAHSVHLVHRPKS